MGLESMLNTKTDFRCIVLWRYLFISKSLGYSKRNLCRKIEQIFKNAENILHDLQKIKNNAKSSEGFDSLTQNVGQWNIANKFLSAKELF